MSNQDEIEEITGTLEIIEDITDTLEIMDGGETANGEETADDESARTENGMDALEEQRIQRRRERMAAMRRKKRRQELLRSWSLVIAAGLLVLALAVWGLIKLLTGHNRESGDLPGEGNQQSLRETEGTTASQGDEEAAGSRETEGTTASQGDEEAAASRKTERAAPQGAEARVDGRKGKGRYIPLEAGNSTEENLPGETSAPDHPTAVEAPQESPPEEMFLPPTVSFAFNPHMTDRTVGFPEEGRGIYSTNGILIDVETEEIIACRDPYQRINPASMTKILTLLVAVEHVEDLQDTFTMTAEIADFTYRHGCSIAGYGVGETVTVEELLYGTVLPSGAEAAMGLAEYVAGSQEAFVEMMNSKLEQLGLSDSAHFTNCVGLYDENHYCTVYDMALILKAATDNELCRRVMSARKYATTVVTEEQPEGILLSNLFLRRIEDKDTHGEVLCAKTGYVDQSGSCAASLATDREGREYICVTTGSISSWTCIYDHVELYQTFLPEVQE